MQIYRMSLDELKLFCSKLVNEEEKLLIANFNKEIDFSDINNISTLEIEKIVSPNLDNKNSENALNFFVHSMCEQNNTVMPAFFEFAVRTGFQAVTTNYIIEYLEKNRAILLQNSNVFSKETSEILLQTVLLNNVDFKNSSIVLVDFKNTMKEFIAKFVSEVRVKNISLYYICTNDDLFNITNNSELKNYVQIQSVDN